LSNMDTSGAGRSVQRPHRAHKGARRVDNLGSDFGDSRV
jgi:hypothetical protein